MKYEVRRAKDEDEANLPEVEREPPGGCREVAGMLLIG